MPYIGKQPTVGNFQVCDAISVVNGQAAYTMQVGGSNVEPENANHMLVSLNGILQKPGSSFTISGSTITFASNLATGDVIGFITLLVKFQMKMMEILIIMYLPLVFLILQVQLQELDFLWIAET